MYGVPVIDNYPSNIVNKGNGWRSSTVSFPFIENRNLSLKGITDIVAIGDSIVFGNNATGSNGYVQQFASKNNLVLTNLAVGGKGWWRTSSDLLNAAYTRANTLVYVNSGLNDIKRGANGYKTLNKIRAGVSTVILKQLATVGGAYGEDCQISGSFSPYASSAVGGLGNGSFNTGGGVCTWSFNFTTTDVGVLLIGNSGDTQVFGTVDIYINNTLVRSEYMGKWYDNISDGSYDNWRGPVAFTFHNLGSGTKTIKVVSKGDGITPVDLFYPLLSPAESQVSGGVTIIGEIPYQTGQGYTYSGLTIKKGDLDTASKIIYDAMQPYIKLGYPFAFFPLNSFYSTAGVDSADGTHPVNNGHKAIFEGLQTIVNDKRIVVR